MANLRTLAAAKHPHPIHHRAPLAASKKCERRASRNAGEVIDILVTKHDYDHALLEKVCNDLADKDPRLHMM